MKIVLTEKEQRYLIRHYRNTKNSELAEHLGYSVRTINRRAAELGLKKTKTFMNRVSREGLAKAHDLNESNDYKAQRMAGLEVQRKWKEKHPGEPYPGTFISGESNLDRHGKRNEKRRLQRSRESRNATIERDRRRVRMGLKPLTMVIKEDVSSRQKILLRNYMKKKYGYMPENREPNLIYYDQATRRSEHLEKEAREYGITIKCKE